LVLSAAKSRIAVASLLGLAPTKLPLYHPLQDLDEKAREATLRQSYDRADRSDGDGNAQPELELAILLASQGSTEGRVDAREYFERARREEPERLEIYLWESQTRAWGNDLVGALQVLEEGRERFHGSPEWSYARGVYQWLLGLRHLDTADLQAAYGSFVTALQQRPRSKTYRLATAAACLALARWEDLLETSTIADDDPAVGPRLLLYRGCALAALGQDDEAERFLGVAVRALSPPLRAVFENGDGFLPADDPDSTRWMRRYWKRLDPHPTRPSNARRLEYWRRLVEADVLCGGEEGVAGWETQAGRLWVRFGRPARTVFVPADIVGYRSMATDSQAVLSAKLSELEGFDEFMGVPAVGRLSWERNPELHRWIWFFDYGPRSFAVTFLDATYGQNWSLAGSSNEIVHAAMEKAPLHFQVDKPRASIDLAVALTGFQDDARESSLETSVAVVLSQAVESPVVELEWAVFDSGGKRVDYVQRTLDPSRRLSRLLASVRTEPSMRASDPLVADIAAKLPPGRFRVAVEATNAASGAHQAREFVVDLAGLDTSDLAVSDLLLTASFEPIDPATALPAEFVRHAQAVIPVADRSFVEGEKHGYVYYEIHGLRRKADLRSDLEVTYRIRPMADGRPLGSKPVKEATFVEENVNTGVAGNLVKGTRLDLDGLPPGAYELTVDVEDRVAERAQQRKVAFHLLPLPPGGDRRGE
jgi:GWxTD domain-containing protein